MLVVGFPLYKNGEIVASAFVYAPVANMNELAAPIRRSIWLVALAAAGPLLLLLWFAARRFANPIRKLDKAARAVAGGDFTLRVDARGQDELARLGMSFNTMAERIERIEEQRRRLIAEIAHELPNAADEHPRDAAGFLRRDTVAAGAAGICRGWPGGVVAAREADR